MKYLFTFILGIAAGIGIHWFLTQPGRDKQITEASERFREKSREVGQSLQQTFDIDSIKDELARTGKVVREKARKAGETIADAATNARITAEIKAKLIRESSLAAFKINVDTTDGVVTLSGTVSSEAQIAKAMEIALSTDGVHKVTSTLQIKAS
jgi:hypothetical protein